MLSFLNVSSFTLLHQHCFTPIFGVFYFHSRLDEIVEDYKSFKEAHWDC